jgi:hypothetical protein
MATMVAMLRRRETWAALVLLAGLPTLFLFQPHARVGPGCPPRRGEPGCRRARRGRLHAPGAGVDRSKGADMLHQRLGVATSPSPNETRDAVLTRDVAAGLVVPAGATASLQAGHPVALGLVRSDAGDLFTNALTANLAGSLGPMLDAALPAALAGQQARPLVTVEEANAAATPDFRYPGCRAASCSRLGRHHRRHGPPSRAATRCGRGATLCAPAWPSWSSPSWAPAWPRRSRSTRRLLAREIDARPARLPLAGRDGRPLARPRPRPRRGCRSVSCWPSSFSSSRPSPARRLPVVLRAGGRRLAAPYLPLPRRRGPGPAVRVDAGGDGRGARLPAVAGLVLAGSGWHAWPTWRGDRPRVACWRLQPEPTEPPGC